MRWLAAAASYMVVGCMGADVAGHYRVERKEYSSCDDTWYEAMSFVPTIDVVDTGGGYAVRHCSSPESCYDITTVGDLGVALVGERFYASEHENGRICILGVEHTVLERGERLVLTTMDAQIDGSGGVSDCTIARAHQLVGVMRCGSVDRIIATPE